MQWLTMIRRNVWGHEWRNYQMKNNGFNYYAWGVDADNRLVKRYFRTRTGAETWAFANLTEIWRIDHV